MKKRKVLGGGGYLRKLGYPTVIIVIVGMSVLLLQHSNQNHILQEKSEENELAIYLEDEPINYIPEKDSGYTLDIEKSSCTNGVEISFDYNTWSVKTNYENYTATDNQRVKCSLYFKKRTFAESLVDCGALNKDAGICIKENYYLTDEVVSDDTSDNNLRFIGAAPENYVWFNDEVWRIIGVMNNIDNGSGKKEARLKIIRNESIGEYSWDNKANGTGSSESIYGSNDWTDSALQIVLNSGAYYNRTSGECPYGQNGATTTCNFTESGLKDNAKNMIENAVWNLGGVSSNSSNENGYVLATTRIWYQNERNTNVYNGRPTEWTGQIGLLYPSDYGYATSGGTIGRDTCLNISIYQWYDSPEINYPECFNNSWLYKETPKWTLTPNLSNSNNIYILSGSGRISTNHVYLLSNTVYPTLYLSSNIKITEGVGTEENPFQLSL